MLFPREDFLSLTLLLLLFPLLEERKYFICSSTERFNFIFVAKGDSDVADAGDGAVSIHGVTVRWTPTRGLQGKWRRMTGRCW